MTGRHAPETLETLAKAAIAEGLVREDEPAALFHDLDMVDARLDSLETAFPPGTLHAVAIKAQPLLGVLKHVAARGFGLEAASREEVALALAAGCPPDRVLYDSPAKTVSELKEALELGVRINADHLDEVARLADLAPTTPPRLPVGVRVNPAVGPGSIKATSVAARSARFGVPLGGPSEAALVEAFRTHPWLGALHVHVGSQGISLDQLVEAAHRVEALARRLGRIELVDLGGGLPVAYMDNAHPPTPEDYVDAIAVEVPGVLSGGWRLATEFGRYVHANAGWALSRVEAVPEREGEPMAVIHLGADFHLRRAYRPEDWPLEVLVLDAEGRLKEGPRAPTTIVGPLCFAGDVLVRGAMLPAIAPGDHVVLRDVGAYTLSMWSRHCSRGIPAAYAHAGPMWPRFTLLRKRERPEDVVAFWS